MGTSYTQNKWRVIDNILYVQVGAGSAELLDENSEAEIARIPIKGNPTFEDAYARIWIGAVGGSVTTACFIIRQLDDY